MEGGEEASLEEVVLKQKPAAGEEGPGDLGSQC